MLTSRLLGIDLQFHGSPSPALPHLSRLQDLHVHLRQPRRIPSRHRRNGIASPKTTPALLEAQSDRPQPIPRRRRRTPLSRRRLWIGHRISRCLQSESLPSRGLRVFSEKMKKVKCLNCSKILSLSDEDLLIIAKVFPSIEVLDISYPEECDLPTSKKVLNPISDAGILSLSSKAKKLKKINVSGNHFLTDKSLYFLATNCPLLSDVCLRSIYYVTRNGIALLLSGCSNLNSVSVTDMGFSNSVCTLKYSMKNAKSLCNVDFTGSALSDKLLRSMVHLPPLKKLVLAGCVWFTFDGLSVLLSKQKTIKHLDLQAVPFLTDDLIAELLQSLQQLTQINLSCCKNLTERTFFDLMTNSPFLMEVKMISTNLGSLNAMLTAESIPNKTRIKRLYLGRNRNLGNEGLKSIASVCPNLEILDLRFCLGVTEHGILEALKRCPKIRQLNLNNCTGIKSFALDFELPKLEVLCVSELGIDDSALGSIGNQCPLILQLDLTGCLRVTEKGVKEIVKKCKSLREINLMHCNNVGSDIVTWMVLSRPTLRKIVPPSGFVPSKSEKNFFLRHGCRVCEG